MENSIATAGTIETTYRASLALMENMTTMEPIRYVECQMLSISDHDTSEPILEESLMILACRYPTLFWLKNENARVCRWLNSALRISLFMLTSTRRACSQAM